MKKMLTLAALGALAIAPLHAPLPAAAAILTTNLLASATIGQGCTALTAPTPLAFGTGILPGAQPSAAGSISSTCTPGTVGTLTFSDGLNGAAGVRALKSVGVATLPYGLFSDAVFAVPIPTAGITLAASTGTAIVTPVYARLVTAIPVGTPNGTYTDTVLVTITF